MTESNEWPSKEDVQKAIDEGRIVFDLKYDDDGNCLCYLCVAERAEDNSL